MAPTVDEGVVGLHFSRVVLGHAVALGWCGPQLRGPWSLTLKSHPVLCHLGQTVS